MRKAVIHYHIFKNAGSSLDHWLKTSFGSDWSSFESGTPDTLLNSVALENFLASHPTLRAVSSHTLKPPIPRGFDIFPITFIRHPLDRAFSVYAHEAGCQPNTLSCQIARKTDFAGYVEWCLGEGRERGGVVIRDYQVVHLSAASFRNGHIYSAEAQQSDLSQAIDFLAELPFIGIVDRLDQQFDLLRRTLQTWSGWDLSDLFERTNVGLLRPAELSERLLDAECRLGRQIARRFLDANALDLALYHWACLALGSQVTLGNLI